jgi:AcrR family transcriptional regulator
MAANLEPSTDARPSGSKLDLIQATVAAISQHGLSDLTSAKIASAAGHTAASINFHFGSKEALLLATLREVSEEFAAVMAGVFEDAGDDDLRALLSIIDTSLGRGLSDSHKIAVWYAFLAETNARGDYQRICGERDQAWAAPSRISAAADCRAWQCTRGPIPRPLRRDSGLIDQQVRDPVRGR